MTALGKLVRTTAFKLSRAYLVVFTLFAFFLARLCLLERRSASSTTQIVATIDAEINGLAEQYRRGGMRRLVAIDRAALARAGRLALPRHHVGRASASPATSASCRRASSTGRAGPRPLFAQRGRASRAEHRAIVRVFVLPGGFRLLVGRDLEERDAAARRDPAAPSAPRWPLIIVLGVRRRLVRHPPRPEARRRHDRDRRARSWPATSTRPPADRRHRRRVRPPRREPQRHARPHRRADGRPARRSPTTSPTTSRRR